MTKTRIVTKCGDCPFRLWVGGVTYACRMTNTNINNMETLPGWCPLREASILVSILPMREDTGV